MSNKTNHTIKKEIVQVLKAFSPKANIIIENENFVLYDLSYYTNFRNILGLNIRPNVPQGFDDGKRSLEQLADWHNRYRRRRLGWAGDIFGSNDGVSFGGSGGASALPIGLLKYTQLKTGATEICNFVIYGKEAPNIAILRRNPRSIYRINLYPEECDTIEYMIMI